MVVPKGKAPGRKAHGKEGWKWKCSKPQARKDTVQPMVAMAKGKGRAAYPLVQAPPCTDHLKAYTASLAMA